jgi:hypothetical protein
MEEKCRETELAGGHARNYNGSAKGIDIKDRRRK